MLFDVILIVVGVVGMGVLIVIFLWVIEVLCWGGVVFLMWYGVWLFVLVWCGGEVMVVVGDGG